jgi:hypothetical protein
MNCIGCGVATSHNMVITMTYSEHILTPESLKKTVDLLLSTRSTAGSRRLRVCSVDNKYINGDYTTWLSLNSS